MKRYLLPLAIFVALAAVLAVALHLNDREIVPSPLVGKAAPELGASRLLAPDERLTLADIRGEVALVNVWASWCVACREEHAYISALAEQGVPIYGLNYKDTRAEARQWLSEFGNPYDAIVFDKEGDIGMDWGVYGVPETFLLDADGRIRYKHIGAITRESMEEEILPRVQRLREEADA
ncbi:Thiol:disulfide interchange protein DsbE [wastewater metagenome]|uniref:Thiol:disulfide interchange protein DsbE n=3 Tax=root TaxID=1 RepID=A0A5B8R9V7_9ZZZZ|nr:DsbE family thiol:disulfide interchange protein [Arhodomonas aquaeolei]QEA04152.1 thiol:disulfide interchange protein DsbE [uncultured organism]